MAQFWDSRYSDTDFAYGTTPNDFLVEQCSKIPAGGRVLCLAEGEGRNAVFLAKQGYAVTAVDQSETGLSEFDIESNYFDGIVSIFGHLPPKTRLPLHVKAVEALKPTGVFLLEAYTVKHYDMPGIGGPPPQARETMNSLEELKNELRGLDLIVGQEVEREVKEGKYHQGLSATVQVVGKKN